MKNRYTKVTQLCLFVLMSGLLSNIQTAQGQTNMGFESSPDLTGWTGVGATISTGQTLLSWTIKPADLKMAAIVPSSNYMSGSAESALGLSSGTMSTKFGGSVTNFGILYQDIYIAASGTVSFYWNYVSEDYSPYNDGSFASLTKSGTTQQIKCLVMTVANISDVGILPTGSYGSSGWHIVTFTATDAGTYRLGFGCFNWADQGYQPHL